MPIDATTVPDDDQTQKDKKTETLSIRQESAIADEVGFGSGGSFALLQRAAALLAASTLVPEEYRANLPNCAVALNMAARIGADPLMVMQNLHVIHGRPGWSSQFLIASFNQSGRFTALRYEWDGERGSDTRACRAWATEKVTGERLEGSWVTMTMVKAEGWYDRKDKHGNPVSKWRTMPEQMFMYRSAAFFIRAYAPEIAWVCTRLKSWRTSWKPSARRAEPLSCAPTP